MHKIDSSGATVDNLFTEGNPALAIPATVVSADIMNALQMELCNVVTEAGLSLLTSGTDTRDQVKAAVKILIERGGRSAPVIQSIVNNQTSPADVTSFPTFSTADIAAIEFLYTVFRKTGSSNVKETGRAYLTWNSETSSWGDVAQVSQHDASGVIFNTALVSGSTYKLQYTSDDLTGSSYSGSLKITDIKYVRNS